MMQLHSRCEEQTSCSGQGERKDIGLKINGVQRH